MADSSWTPDQMTTNSLRREAQNEGVGPHTISVKVESTHNSVVVDTGMYELDNQHRALVKDRLRGLYSELWHIGPISVRIQD